MEKYREIRWNKEIAIERERNANKMQKPLVTREQTPITYFEKKEGDWLVIKIASGIILAFLVLDIINLLK